MSASHPDENPEEKQDNDVAIRPSSKSPKQSQQQNKNQSNPTNVTTQSNPISTPSATDITDSAHALLAVSTSRPPTTSNPLPSTPNNQSDSNLKKTSSNHPKTITTSPKSLQNSQNNPNKTSSKIKPPNNQSDQIQPSDSKQKQKSGPRAISTSPATDTTPSPQLPAIGANDVIFVNGEAFNGRGYRVCGVANQRGRLCGRIGTCPFHAGKPKGILTPKRPRPWASSNVASNGNKNIKNTTSGDNENGSKEQDNNKQPSTVTNTNDANNVTNGSINPNVKRPRLLSQDGVRQLTAPPQKSRFKRSWTTEEHVLFLQAMKRHGKGKWKEISKEVKTRTANQCQSHAQKYFLRQAKSDSERKKKSIHDVTEKDMPDSIDETKSGDSKSKQISADGPKPDSTVSPGIRNTARGTSSASAVPLAPRPATVGSSNIPSEQVTSSATPSQSAGEIVPHSAQSTISLPLTAMKAQSLTALTNGVQVVSTSGSTVPVIFPMHGVQYAPLMQQFLTPGLGNPGAAAVVAPPPPAKLRVTVHVNGKLKGGMALVLPDAWDQFFETAKTKLNFSGEFKRVFARSGGEITSLDEMCQDDMLWLSPGEDFLTPR